MEGRNDLGLLIWGTIVVANREYKVIRGVDFDLFWTKIFRKNIGMFLDIFGWTKLKFGNVMANFIKIKTIIKIVFQIIRFTN